ncbi:MAG: hypothetical protein ACOC1F_13905 [Myxococcota bacterium]
MKRRPLLRLPALPACISAVVLLVSSSAQAQNYQVLDEQLDAQGEGYTVVRVWGSHHEIGFAIGVAFAQEIVSTSDEVRALAGSNYDLLRSAMGFVTWVPDGIEHEFEGLADGVQSVLPAAAVDAVDMMILNTYGDWAYPPACRSHSCWGSRTEAPYSTISTRRLDFGSPFAAMHHHVLYAVQPSDGSARWVNMAWPGFVSVVTGVNRHGTLVSLHDFNSTVSAQPGVVSRSMATRQLVSAVPSTPVADHLAWAQQRLASYDVATGTFINFYAPDGHGGVFTCAAGQSCTGPREPQNAYLGGEVLITTNSQTDGLSTPYGAEFLNAYYAQPSPKSPESHFDVMVADELHMLTVGFRGPGDMRLLAHGRTSTGWTPRIDVEWSSLFTSAPADAGVDGAVGDAATEPDGATQPDAMIAPDADLDAGLDAAGPDAAGPDAAGPDAAGPDAGEAASPGGSDAGPPVSGAGSGADEDGCGCSVPGRVAGAETWWLLAGSLLGLGRLRVRRASRPAA